MPRKTPAQAPLPFFLPTSEWTPPNMATLPSWADRPRMSIDLETCDPTLHELGPGVRRGGFIVGVSFAFQDENNGQYLPIAHREGGNLPKDQVLAYLRDNAKTYTGELCGANLLYALDYLEEAGVSFPHAKLRDVQIAAPLIWEHHDSYSLDAIAGRLGIIGKDESLLKEAAGIYNAHPKKELYKLPAKYVGPYAERDAVCPLEVFREQEITLTAQGLDRVFQLETELQPVILRMIRRGVRIDWEKLEEVETWAFLEEQKCYDIIKQDTGISIGSGDIWTAGPLARVLKSMGIHVPMTKTGKPSVTKELLGSLGSFKAAIAIGQARKFNKLRTTFVASVREHATNGRLHCEFNQLRKSSADEEFEDDLSGGRFGRISSSHLNIQQQPSHDDFANFWRSIYVPEEGSLWACKDYSQQEPRMTIHYAAVCKCTGGAAARQKYIDNPATDNHTMTARLCYGYPDDVEPPKNERKVAKVIFLGKAYGMGGGKLARTLGLPTVLKTINGRRYEAAGPEAQKIIDQFDARLPFLKELAKLCEHKAAAAGSIKTLLGRVCHFEQDDDGGFKFVHKALNRLIQGSSADQTKQAMIEVDRAGAYLQLQVHDELDSSVGSKEEALRYAHIMEHCVETTVPSKVDVEVGPSWGEIH